MNTLSKGNLLEKLEDLAKQAASEKSHYYVAATVGEAHREIVSLRKTIKALKNPNRCPNCHVAYTPKTCMKPCNGPGGSFPCDYPKCVGK